MQQPDELKRLIKEKQTMLPSHNPEPFSKVANSPQQPACPKQAEIQTQS